MQYNAVIEVGVKPTKSNIERWIDAFADYSPAISPTDDGNTEMVVTIDTMGSGSMGFGQASATALAIGRDLGHVRAVTIMTTEEFDRRVDAMGADETVTTNEAAELLGVTRQRVQQLINDGQLPSRKVGRDRLIPAKAVEARIGAITGSIALSGKVTGVVGGFGVGKSSINSAGRLTQDEPRSPAPARTGPPIYDD